MDSKVEEAIDEAHEAAGEVYNDAYRFSVQQSLVIAKSLLGRIASDIAAMEEGMSAAAVGIAAMADDDG